MSFGSGKLVPARKDKRMEGNTAWSLTSAALVLFMVPGLALFYGGMVRAKNALNMLNMNMWCLGIVPVVWVLLGLSLIHI